jgi:hypothetical protein
MNNYRPGDGLFIIGFSRGAFAARVLSNFIARLGVLTRECKRDNFSSCQDETAPTLPLGGAQVPRSYQVEIEVVGCWNTVPVKNPGGVSENYEYLDASLVKGF